MAISKRDRRSAVNGLPATVPAWDAPKTPLPLNENKMLGGVVAVPTHAQGTRLTMLNISAQLTRFRLRHGRQTLLCLCLMLSASCVPSMSDRPSAGMAAPPLSFAAKVSPAEAPPAPEPLELQELAPDTALALNAAIPLSTAYNPPAARFLLRHAGMADRLRSLECLTTAIYYEAASESDDGQRAVAQVVLNRVRHPTFPNTVCGVVYQGSERASGCQFSFTCDGSLARTPSAAGWARAGRIAAEALAGYVYAPVGYATHYHTQQVLPHWAPSLVKSAVIGAHIFYRWTGVWGTPAAFRQSYAGGEPLPGPKLALAAVPAPQSSEMLRAEVAMLLSADAHARTRRETSAVAAAPTAEVVDPRYIARGLPESRVLDAWQNSGRPRDQATAPRAN